MEQNKLTKIIEVGDIVMARYSNRSKWKQCKVWEIDNNRTLPYGISEQCTDNYHGQLGMWLHSFRVKQGNIMAINPDLIQIQL